MKFPPPLIFVWPAQPPLPPAGQAVVLRVTTTALRSVARQELRKVLRAVLTAWSGLPANELPLRETSAGPVWQGELAGQPLDLSLSYGGGSGWIGLLRSGRIGLDALAVAPIPEAAAIARNYFDPEAWKVFRETADPALAFTAAWTNLEARLKCAKQPLAESSATATSVRQDCVCHRLLQPDQVCLTVAIG